MNHAAAELLPLERAAISARSSGPSPDVHGTGVGLLPAECSATQHLARIAWLGSLLDQYGRFALTALALDDGAGAELWLRQLASTHQLLSEHLFEYRAGLTR